MTDTILIVFWPFAFALFVTVLEFVFSRTKKFGVSHVSDLKLPKHLWQNDWKDKTGKPALSFLIIWTAAVLQFMVSMVSLYLVRRYAFVPGGNVSNIVNPAVFAVADAVSDICILYLIRSQKRRAVRSAVIIAVLSYAVLAAELFLFNFNCFKADPHAVYLKGSSLVPEFESDATDENGPLRYEGDIVLVKKDTSFYIPDVPDDAYSVTVKFSREKYQDRLSKEKDKLYPKRFWCRLSIEDRNSMYEYQISDIRKVSGLRASTMFMKPHGNIKSVMLSLETLKMPVRIESVTIANCNVYSTFFARYLLVLLVLSLMVIITDMRLYKIDFDSRNKVHALLLTAVFFLTSGVTYALYYNKEMKFEKYPFEDTSKVTDIYQLAFDSRMKRIPHLDIPVSDDLKNMDNPYDVSERDKKHVDYRWDYAYKDGHYYCYYGMAPVYALYYPAYLISHSVPNYAAAVGILGTLATIGVLLAFLAAVRMFVPKKNLLMLLLLMPAVAAASFVYNNMAYPERYYVACESAIAGICFAVFFGLSAVKAKKTWERLVLFFLSGLSLAFCAGARPVAAVSAAALLPVFFGVLLDRSRKLRSRLTEALVFIVPVVVSIVLILMENKYKFGSIFDFGENYQLTVSDISSLKITPEMFPSAIYYFFLMPFSLMDTFPYFEPRGIISYTYEIYRNIEPSVGILSIPLILAGTVFMPGAFIKAKGSIKKKDAFVFNGFVITGIVTSLFITWFDFSRGGVCIRYLSDFAWLLAITSGVILLRRIMRRSGRKTVYGIICLVAVLTVAAIFFSLLSNDINVLARQYPTFLEECEDFFMFWH